MSIWTLVNEKMTGEVWSLQERSFVVVLGALGALVLALPFRNRRSVADRERETAFWERTETPIDFEKEVGGSLDGAQARITGNLILVTGGLLLAFLLVPNSTGARVAILILGGFVLGCGALLRWAGGRKGRA
jgi:hypothetical protein